MDTGYCKKMFHVDSEVLRDSASMILQLRSSIEGIEQNWIDDYGRQYTGYLRRLEEMLKKTEARRLSLYERMGALEDMCNSILGDEDTDAIPAPPVKRLLRTQRDNSPSNEGRSR